MVSPLASALASPLPVDRYLDLIHPTLLLREVRAEVTAVRRQTSGSVTLTIEPNANWNGFAAGQHVAVTVEIDGVQKTRLYSLANSAHVADRQLELTVTEHADGEVSTFLNRHARPSMALRLSQADGEFVLPVPRPRRLLLISGGSGITPVMSMLRTLCDEGHADPVTFLHYSRTAADLLYRDELDEIARHHTAVRVVYAFTREASALKGRFSRRHLQVAEPAYADAETFVCGPSGLVDAVRSVWKSDGLEDHLQTEYFVAPAPVLPKGKIGGTVNFSRSGVRVANDGTSLLEQAERAGLTPQHGCRMGICHTCICQMKSGSVRHVRTGKITLVKEENVQVCVNAPVGDVEIEL